MKDPIIIVGAGLSGLRAASLLESQGIACKVLEARERIGGRVLSSSAANRPEYGRFDLGPTWFWPQHEPIISALVREHGLKSFEQHTKGAILLEQSQDAPIQRRELPQGAVEKSLRLAGGVQSLIDAVASTLHQDTVELNMRVTAIRMDENGKPTLEATHTDGRKQNIHARAVILALPPRIVAQHIAFSPSLPDSLMVGLKETPTWMAGQSKVVAIYNRPFWREAGLSGQVMSWVGPLQEVHDASPMDTGYGALFGFFGIPAVTRQKLGKEKVLQHVISQMGRLFGTPAEKPISLLYKDWSTDHETAVDSDSIPLGAFPNYGIPNGTGVWGKKIVFAGTETSSEFGGHLEGALQSAELAVRAVIGAS